MTTTLTPATPPSAPRPRAAAGPLSPARRVTFVVGALITLLTITFGVLTIIAEGSKTIERAEFTITPSGSTFAVETDVGDIKVVSSIDDKVHVVRTAQFGGQRPRFTEEPNSTGDRLEAECAGDWLLSACTVDYQVAVPEGMAVQLRSDTGDVLASNIDGALEASSGTGNVEVRGVEGPLRLRASTGDVSAEGVRSDNVDAHSSTGDVVLSFADAPDNVSAITDTGDVRLWLPVGPYRVDTDTDTGDVTTDVDVDSSSRRTVVARTDTGDVELLRRN